MRRGKALPPCGCESRPVSGAPTGRNRRGSWRQRHGLKHFDGKGPRRPLHERTPSRPRNARCGGRLSMGKRKATIGGEESIAPSGLSARRIGVCRRLAWRCADWIHIGFARSEVPRIRTVFPGPVSTAIRPCTVRGFPRLRRRPPLPSFIERKQNSRRTPSSLPISMLPPGPRPSPFSQTAAGAL